MPTLPFSVTVVPTRRLIIWVLFIPVWRTTWGKAVLLGPPLVGCLGSLFRVLNHQPVEPQHVLIALAFAFALPVLTVSVLCILFDAVPAIREPCVYTFDERGVQLKAQAFASFHHWR